MIVAYHGTSEEKVASIQREGFRVGTYFAYEIEEARFWGSCVLAAQFEESGFRGENDGWQFTCAILFRRRRFCGSVGNLHGAMLGWNPVHRGHE